MTVKKLHSILAKMIERGHARTIVCCDKPTFSSNLEGDGCVILDVCGAEVRAVLQIDDDGGTKVNSKGGEVYRTCCVLYGSAGEPSRTAAESAKVAKP